MVPTLRFQAAQRIFSLQLPIAQDWLLL